MEIKQGYKQTELGVIPKEWDVKSIDQIFSFYSTSNYSKAQMTLEGDVGCLHYGLIHAIKNSFYNVKSGIKYYVDMQQAKYEFVLDGDIVMVDASEDLSGVNKSVEISGIGAKLYISGLHTFLLRDRGFLAKYFRGAILNSNIAKTQMLRLAVGMKVYGVSKPQIKTVLLPVPPLHEQTAIANALSDMDALISQTEKLIEKKKAIKQGAMQDLLKPKEGWVTRKLGELVIYKNGKAHENCVVDHGEFIIVNSKFVSTEGRVAKYSNENLCPLEKNEILMVLSDIPNGKAIAKCFYVSENNKYTLNQRICSLKAVNIHPKFLFYLVNRNKYFLAFDDGVKQTNLRNEDVLQCPITFPPDYKVQEYSAQVITEIEIVIKLQNIKLTKLKQQKQGMMQALLTGKIRLVS